MKYSIILILLLTCALVSCYDDKGNYDYRDIDELTISNIPEEPLSALYKSENLALTPIVTSRFEGEIGADNPNYEFAYYYNKAAGGDFLEPSLLDSSMVKDLNVLAEMTPGNYTGWFRVKDLRTNIVTSAEFKFEVLTSTTKGWLLMCEEGNDRKVRIDMISEVGERILLSKDILGFLPEMHGASQMLMQSNMYYTSQAPYLNLYAEDGNICIYSYDGNFNTTAYNDPRDVVFARKIDDFIAKEDNNYSYVVVSTDGDAYQKTSSSSALYDVKINVDIPLTEPTYKMAPFIATTWRESGYSGVLYDKTNKAFKYFLSYAFGITNGTKYLFDPTEPDAGTKLFDWKTGKDMVYMAGTNQGSTLAFALMKDAAGAFSIYGMTIGGYMASPAQSLYIELDGTSAPGLENATCYAFCPNLPFLFYNNGSEVYLYDMSTRLARRVVSLSGETVSMLKFNKLPRLGLGYNTNYPDAVIDCQYRLAVGSVDANAEAGSEGILRFYDVPEFAADLIQYGETYSGFGIIKDIAYKAR